jgi:hypothetical protein
MSEPVEHIGRILDDLRAMILDGHITAANEIVYFNDCEVAVYLLRRAFEANDKIGDDVRPETG